MTLERPPREAYARGLYIYKDLEVCAGVELHDADDFRTMRDEIRRACGLAVGKAEQETEQAVCNELEPMLKKRWPDRAYFIEVGNDKEGWIQVYQPYGMPKNQ